jgi:hypothetical protein
VDHHVVATVSIAGTCLDVLGSLYLAYDLLGGQHGPLRLLTKAVTYSLVFGIGYGVGLGPLFGVASGAATGITVALELQRAARHQDHHPLYCEALFAGIRALAFGAGLYPTLGLRFALAFAVLLTIGQTFAYSRGLRPGLDYSPNREARFTRRHLWGTLMRTAGYTAAALICSTFVRHVEHVWPFAMRIGLVTGLVTGIGVAVNPIIEFYADHLPEKRMGVFGIALILCGFSLQSFQYWVSLLDVTVT